MVKNVIFDYTEYFLHWRGFEQKYYEYSLYRDMTYIILLI